MPMFVLSFFGLAKAFANHPWSVTEPEAVGVPGWQTGAIGHCAFTVNPHMPASLSAGHRPG